MEQIAVSFTKEGAPKTGLTPKVTILGRDGSVFVNEGACKELGYGWYIYNFANYNAEKVYLYMFDGGSELDDYDRYKYGGNEFDAYTNKYSWGRTAAPYFTSISGRFDRVDKSFKDMKKLKYDDTEVVKNLNEINSLLKSQGGDSFKSKLDSILRNIREVQDAVVDTSATNDGNSSKNFSGINGKLDLMAEYIVKMKQDVDNELGMLDDNVAQRIMQSNANLNEGMANRVTIEQLLEQVARLENKLNEVVDSVVQEKLSNELLGKYDIRATRKGEKSNEEVMSALGINQGIDEGLDMGLGQTRPEQMNAPVDMQGIAEPVMPSAI